MNKGFHLLDGLMACCIILVAIQGSLLLMKRTKEFETVVQEKRVCWELLRRLRHCPVSVLDANSALEFSYLGEQVESDGFFQVRIGRTDLDGYAKYHVNLSYHDRLGQLVSHSMMRQEWYHE